MHSLVCELREHFAIQDVPPLFLAKHGYFRLKKPGNFKVAGREMCPWIPWEVVADPLGSGGTLRESLDYEYSIRNESRRNIGYGWICCDCFCLLRCFLVYENLLIKYFAEFLLKVGVVRLCVVF